MSDTERENSKIKQARELGCSAMIPEKSRTWVILFVVALATRRYNIQSSKIGMVNHKNNQVAQKYFFHRIFVTWLHTAGKEKDFIWGKVRNRRKIIFQRMNMRKI